jgi:hypothetical protein
MNNRVMMVITIPLICKELEITIHFGIKPIKGGIPPKDSKFTIKEKFLILLRIFGV